MPEPAVGEEGKARCDPVCVKLWGLARMQTWAKACPVATWHRAMIVAPGLRTQRKGGQQSPASITKQGREVNFGRGPRPERLESQHSGASPGWGTNPASPGEQQGGAGTVTSIY